MNTIARTQPFWYGTLQRQLTLITISSMQLELRPLSTSLENQWWQKLNPNFALTWSWNPSTLFQRLMKTYIRFAGSKRVDMNCSTERRPVSNFATPVNTRATLRCYTMTSIRGPFSPSKLILMIAEDSLLWAKNPSKFMICETLNAHLLWLIRLRANKLNQISSKVIREHLEALNGLILGKI